MTWSHGIIHYKAGGYGLHELHYEDGKLIGYSEKPAVFLGDSPDEVIQGLALALGKWKVIEET